MDALKGCRVQVEGCRFLATDKHGLTQIFKEGSRRDFRLWSSMQWLLSSLLHSFDWAGSFWSLGITLLGHMDKLKKVTGTWRGTYSYDPSEHLPNRVPVPFTLVLKQGWFGHFTGSVTDDEVSGMPGTGVIDGYFSFPKIEFKKFMPVCWVAMSDGRRGPLRQFLSEKGHQCDRDIPHQSIFYDGDFLQPNHAEGTWIIRAGPLSVGNGLVVQMRGIKGTWKIENVTA